MKFYNVELKPEQAEKFKMFLKKEGIYFEPSACYNLIHFEIKLNEKDVEKVNQFLESI